MNRAIVDVESAAAKPSEKRNLVVALTPNLQPPSAGHRLLVAFHFGAPGKESRQAVISPGLVPIDQADRYECWWYEGAVEYRTLGDIAIAQCDDYAIISLQRDDVPPEHVCKLTYESYMDMLGAIGTTEHLPIAKFWNYFPNINEGDGDGEKYRQFSIGRAEAFEQAGILAGSVPCGTAVGGLADGKFSIIALTSKHGLLATENPRQVSAYAYPRQYGPRSPRFSRSGCVSARNHKLFVLSGTAAIVGHESAHPYRARLQIDQTLENLAHLRHALAARAHVAADLVLDRASALRVYLREPGDFDEVAPKLIGSLGRGADNVAFLRADICRRELMVEIDGIKVV